MSKYGFGRDVAMSFDAAVSKVTEALASEGFGVLTDIDVSATMKKKIGVEMPEYRILGACNPLLAHRAISAEPSIGLLLPCNVVVRRLDANNVRVEFMDPVAVMELVGRPEARELASEVRQRLERVMQAL